MNEHRALYVGIGKYAHPDHEPLPGAVNDARSLQATLARRDADGPDPLWGRGTLLVGEPLDDGMVSQVRLKTEFDTLVSHAAGDDLLFYFAGHGVEAEGDLILATSDDTPYDVRRGLWLHYLVDEINNSGCHSAVIILDCCGAGHVAGANVGENVVILAGAQQDQTAGENGGRGVFTQFLLDGLNSRAADLRGNITAIGLYNYIAGAMSISKDQQTPVLKARLTAPVIIRQVKATLGYKDLADLKIFSTQDFKYPLDPDFEETKEATRQWIGKVQQDWEDGKDTYRSRNPKLTDFSDKQGLMEYFKLLRNAGLIKIIDDPKKNPNLDLYWACIDKGAVELTPLGQYYWQLAVEDRLSR